MMRKGKDSKAAQPIDWHLNRLPCGLTRLVRWWFGTGVFPPSVAANGAPEVAVALYLVGLLGWLFLMHSVKYTQPTPLDVPEYLRFLAEACRSGSASCGAGSSPAQAGFEVVPDAHGRPRLRLPYPTSLLLGRSLLPLAADAGAPAWEGAEALAAVRLAAFVGMLSTIFALLLSRLCSGSAVSILRMTAAVGSSIFCLGFGALEAAVRWHGHLWIAPAFANVGIAVFCAFLAAGVDATHFLARWAFYCTLVPLYFTAGAHKLKVGGLHWSACQQIGHWAKDQFHWKIPLPDLTRFILSHKYVCLMLTASTLAFQLGVGLAEALPWLLRPLLPLVALGFHLGVWFLMHICFGGHCWVWCLCVDVIQLILRLFAGQGPAAPARPPPAKPRAPSESSDDEAVTDEPQSLQCTPECSDSDQGTTAVRPKAAAAAAACTIASLAVLARGLVSAWVPGEDSDQWPFTSMDMFA